MSRLNIFRRICLTLCVSYSRRMGDKMATYYTFIPHVHTDFQPLATLHHHPHDVPAALLYYCYVQFELGKKTDSFFFGSCQTTCMCVEFSDRFYHCFISDFFQSRGNIDETWPLCRTAGKNAHDDLERPFPFDFPLPPLGLAIALIVPFTDHIQSTSNLLSNCTGQMCSQRDHYTDVSTDSEKHL